MTMGLYVDRVELPSAILKREPYLVALVATGTTTQVEVRSQVFKGIRRKHPLYLNGFELLPAGDTGGFVAARVVVMESDAGYRRLGRLIAKGLDVAKKLPAGQAFLAGFANVSAAGASAAKVLDKVVEHLKGNGDDEMAAIDVELDLRDGRWWLLDTSRPLEFEDSPQTQGPPGAHVAEDGGFSFVRGSNKARVTMRFATSRGAGLKVGLEEVGFAPPKSRKLAPGVAVRLFHKGRVHVGRYLGRRGASTLVLARPVTGATLEFGAVEDAVEIMVNRPEELVVDMEDFDDYAAFLRTVLCADRREERMGQWAFNVLVRRRPDIAEKIRGDADFDPFAAGDVLPEFLGRVAELWKSGDGGDR